MKNVREVKKMFYLPVCGADLLRMVSNWIEVVVYTYAKLRQTTMAARQTDLSSSHNTVFIRDPVPKSSSG